MLYSDSEMVESPGSGQLPSRSRPVLKNRDLPILPPGLRSARWPPDQRKRGCVKRRREVRALICGAGRDLCGSCYGWRRCAVSRWPHGGLQLRPHESPDGSEGDQSGSEPGAWRTRFVHESVHGMRRDSPRHGRCGRTETTWRHESAEVNAGDQRPPETAETGIVWLITQRCAKCSYAVGVDWCTYDPWTGGEYGIPDWAIDDPDEDAFFVRVWPSTLAEAMRCLACNAEVDWRPCRDRHTGRFVCPECGSERPSHNASKQLRKKVGDRDGWICHRCRLPIDSALEQSHPLSPVADHYPIPRNDGGPAILANLRIAHALCNGNTTSARHASWQAYPSDQRRLLEAIVKLPVDGNGHTQAPPGH